MLLKYRSVLIIVLLVVATAAAGAFFVLRGGGEKPAFAEDGYVFGEMAEKDDGGYASTPIRFRAGTTYESNYKANLTFVDEQNQKVDVEDYGFVHYNDGALAALKPGVAMNLARLDSEGVTCYAVASGNIMEKAGDAYTISHLDSELSFESLVWKLDDTKYLFAGNSLGITVGSEQLQTAGTFVEVNYIDDSVIQIITEEETILTVSPVAALTMGSGIEVDLTRRMIESGSTELPMAQLVVDAADNVSLNATGGDAAVKLPTFTVIDGESGEEGVEGADGVLGTEGGAGSAGSAGDLGSEGEEGAFGDEGASGASGAAGAGVDEPVENADGSTEEVIKPNIPNYELPVFTLSEWNVTAITAKGLIDVDVAGKIQLDDNSLVLTIVNTRTGVEVPGVVFDTGSEPYAVATDQLEPGAEYRLTLRGSYTVDGVSYNRDFVSKVFIADNIGVTLLDGTKFTNGVTTASLKVNVYKEPYSYAKSVTVKIYAAGAPTTEINSHSLSFPSPYVEADNIVEFMSLYPNTKYIIRLFGLNYETPDGEVISQGPTVQYGQDLAVTTLKDLSAAVLPAPLFSANRYESTFSVWPASMTTINTNDIISYRYEFYTDGVASQFVRAGAPPATVLPPALLPDMEPFKFITAESRSPQTAPVSMPAQGLMDNFQWGESYRVRLVVEYSDNQYIRTLTSPFTDIVSLTGTQQPVVTYIPSQNPGQSVDPLYDRVEGTLRVSYNGADVDTARPITLSFESNTINHVISVDVAGGDFSFLPAGANASNDTGLSIAVNMPYLKQDDQYTISLWAYTNLQDGNGYRLMSLGRMGAVTAQSNPFAVYLPNAAELEATTLVPGSIFTVETYLMDTEDNTNLGKSNAYEASNLATVTYKLYAGADDQGALLGSFDITSGVPGPKNSTLDDGPGALYKGAYKLNSQVSNPLKITDVSFGAIAAACQDAGVVTLVVEKAQDYTVLADTPNAPNGPKISTFENSFALQDTRSTGEYIKPLQVQIRVSATAPAPPADGDGLTVTPILEGTAVNYVTGYQMRPDVDTETVVGFAITAKFPSPLVADYITYSLYQSGLHPTQPGNVDGPLQSIQSDELLDANRTQVNIGNTLPGAPTITAEEAETPAYAVRLPILQSSNGTVPTLIVMFGERPVGNMLGDPTTGDCLPTTDFDTSDRSTFFKYLRNEANLRGLNYYATFTAKLNIPKPGESSVNPTDPYIYPRDYNSGFYNGSGNGNLFDFKQLYSKRLAAPKQAAAFVRYPSNSTNANETWKFTLSDLDSTIPEGTVNGAADDFDLHVVSSLAAQPDRVGDVSAPKPANSGTWSTMTLYPAGGIPSELYPEGAYTASYQQSRWQYATNTALDSTQKTVNFAARYHHAVIGDTEMQAAAGTWEIKDLPDRNSVFFAIQNLTAVERTLLYNRSVALEVRAVSFPTDKTVTIPIERLDLGSGNEVVCAPLPYSTISGLGFVQSDIITFSVKIVYDTGTRGMDIGTGFDGYAIQTVGQGVSPEAPGWYYTLSTVGAFQPLTAHPNASGQYYAQNSTQFNVLMPPITANLPRATLAYLSVANTADKNPHNGTINLLLATPEGASNNASPGGYLALKGLKTATLPVIAGIDTDKFTMAAVAPEIRDETVIDRTENAATIRFTVFGGDALKTDTSVSLKGPIYITLQRKSKSGGAATGVPTYPTTTGDGSVTSPGNGLLYSLDLGATWSIYPGGAASEDDTITYDLTGDPKPSGSEGNASIIKLYWDGAVDNAKTYTIMLKGLQQETDYQFQVKGPVVGKDGPFAGGNIDDGIRSIYFYDVLTQMTGRVYTFSTVKSLEIGTTTPITVVYNATDYTTKRLDISYSVTAAGSYKIEYVFQKANAVGGFDAPSFDVSTGNAKKFDSTKSILINPMSDSVPVPIPGDPFWIYGDGTPANTDLNGLGLPYGGLYKITVNVYNLNNLLTPTATNSSKIGRAHV